MELPGFKLHKLTGKEKNLEVIPFPVKADGKDKKEK